MWDKDPISFLFCIWLYSFPNTIDYPFPIECSWSSCQIVDHLCMGFISEGFPNSSVCKEPACNAGGPSSIPGSGRSAGEGKGYPLQYSGLENSMNCKVHGVAKSWTWLSDFHFHYTSLYFWAPYLIPLVYVSSTMLM